MGGGFGENLLGGFPPRLVRACFDGESGGCPRSFLGFGYGEMWNVLAAIFGNLLIIGASTGVGFGLHSTAYLDAPGVNLLLFCFTINLMHRGKKHSSILWGFGILKWGFSGNGQEFAVLFLFTIGFDLEYRRLINLSSARLVGFCHRTCTMIDQDKRA